jgi:hypothetical protein
MTRQKGGDENAVKRSRPSTSRRPALRYRPLGLTIAILATALGYGIVPLLPIMLVIWTQLTGRSIGADLVNSPGNWIGMALGVLTLIVSVLAWIGRPYGVRLALLVLVWITTAFTLFRLLQSLGAPPDMLGEVGEIGGSLSGAGTALLCQGPILIFVPLYVTWYLNRAPARAFYRRQ